MKGVNNIRKTNEKCECDEHSQLKSLIIILLHCFYNFFLISFIFFKVAHFVKKCKESIPFEV